MLLTVLFAVSMLLWLVLALVPTPYAQARAVFAWLSVFFLAMMAHAIHF